MNDSIPSPNVKTELRQGNFTLVIYAYRPLSRTEALRVASQWLTSHHRKSLPASGSVTVHTTIGFVP